MKFLFSDVAYWALETTGEDQSVVYKRLRPAAATVCRSPDRSDTRPAAGGPHPAILYTHSHGDRHDIGSSDLIERREYLMSQPGPVFAQADHASLAIDMPTFGKRNDVNESAAAKALIWYGKLLVGR